MKKYHLENLNRYIYIEDFDGKNNEEEERAKVFDENMEYIDYISLDGKTEADFNSLVEDLTKAKNIEDFIEFLTGETSYDYSENLSYLLDSVFDDADEEFWKELHHDTNIMNEKELCEKYSINRIGNFYFNLPW